MGRPLPLRRTTAAEYLSWEREQPEKHVFWDGEIFAMAGASLAHNRIVANLLRELGLALRDGPCAPYPSDLKVRIAAERYVYPDVSVLCAPIEVEAEHDDVVCNPRVVIEVLSESTEGFDRGPKFEGYRALPSVREIVFVSQDHRLVEHYLRADDAWTLREHRGTDVVALASVDARLALDELYRGLQVA
jgi:Uma2 family endonuclease